MPTAEADDGLELEREERDWTLMMMTTAVVVARPRPRTERIARGGSTSSLFSTYWQDWGVLDKVMFGYKLLEITLPICLNC